MNLDHYLHAHIEARYNWEPEQFKQGPSYFYPKEQRYAEEFEYSEQKYGELKRNITAALNEIMKTSGY